MGKRKKGYMGILQPSSAHPVPHRLALPSFGGREKELTETSSKDGIKNVPAAITQWVRSAPGIQGPSRTLFRFCSPSNRLEEVFTIAGLQGERGRQTAPHTQGGRLDKYLATNYLLI